MDIFMPIAICVIFLILFTICGWCCKRKREGTVYGRKYLPRFFLIIAHSIIYHYYCFFVIRNISKSNSFDKNLSISKDLGYAKYC